MHSIYVRTYTSTFALGRISILKNLLRQMFLPVCIFPNAQQINIFQSHRRLDLLLHLLILLRCRKFSFSEHFLMNALSFCRYISYLNMFFDGLSCYFFLLFHQRNGFNCEHSQPSGENDSSGTDHDVWAFCRLEELINES